MKKGKWRFGNSALVFGFFTGALSGCSVDLTDRTGSLVFDPPANTQTFQADVEAEGLAVIQGVLLSVDGGPKVPMTRGLDDRWTFSHPVRACLGAVEYKYTVEFGPVITSDSDFPQIGSFRAPVAGQPASCDSLLPPAVTKTFRVNTTEDLTDANPGDGFCDTDTLDGTRTCSLRAAVMEANAFPGPDLILVPVGRYRLELTGPEDDDVPRDAVGDLDITDAVTVHGLAPETRHMGDFLNTDFRDLLRDDPSKDLRFTKVDGNQIDRVFQVFPGTGENDFVGLENLMMVNGLAADRSGGGVENRGTLALRRVVVAENRLRLQSSTSPRGVVSLNRGAGIANSGTLVMQDSAAVHNLIEDGTGFAGGLFNTQGAEARVEGSLFAFNEGRIGSAIYNAFNPESGAVPGLLTLESTTLTGNRVPGAVEGVLVNLGTASLTYVTLVNNLPSRTGILGRGSTSIQNSILARNGDDCSGTLDSYGGNSIQNPSCTIRNRLGSDVAGRTPRILDLSHRGGFTFVIPLVIGDPIVDLIDADSTLRCLGKDQRGISRPIDGDGDGDADCDPGAYERNS